MSREEWDFLFVQPRYSRNPTGPFFSSVTGALTGVPKSPRLNSTLAVRVEYDRSGTLEALLAVAASARVTGNSEVNPPII